MILYAAIALVLFLAIGFGVVYGGRQLGVLPAQATTGSGGATPQPSSASVAQIAPTEQPVIVPTQVPPTPTATPDPGCPSAAAWWNNSQIQSFYMYFTQQALNDARGSSRISWLAEQMQIWRDIVDKFRMNGSEDDPCLDPLRADLVRAFDATISAARVINTDDAAAAQQMAAADQAYADLFDALRTFGVTVNEPTPSA